ncbi:MAG: 30S ribosome-binding factor RbfA [Candidatus Omnitrophica bacterium]|nr:30S ribosome-binding factor RbfA [Candidatus Omnitrophota bacterium]
MSRLIERVNRQIKKEISMIIEREIDDPRLEFISIVRVDTSRDLSLAKIYFSVYPESGSEVAKETLEEMNKFIRVLLGRRIRLKFLPALEFIIDDSVKYSVDIYEKMEKIKDELGEDSQID